MHPATFLLVAAAAALVFQEGDADGRANCVDINSCVEALTAEGDAAEAAEQRLQSFGAAAVDRLVERLFHADRAVRNAAGMALGGFERIDPRHLPALIAAYEGTDPRTGGERNGWMPRPIAATGNDQALAILQRAFLDDPQQHSNGQVHFALARFGEARLRPFVGTQLESCRTSSNAELCHGLAELLGELTPFPDWGLEAIAAVARSPAASADVRHAAEYELIQRRHPQGLAALMRDLEQARAFLLGSVRHAVHPQLGDEAMQDSHVAVTIRDIGNYGESGQQAAALLLWFLTRDDLPDARAAAALALGRLGIASAAPRLAGLEPAFADDWLLAYNAVESLGRLRSAAARPLLERSARDHWYAPVRNNAQRALNVLSGGAFERPDVARDGAPFEAADVPGEAILYSGDLRYRGDRDLPTWCSAEHGAQMRLQQNPVAAAQFPRTGTRFQSFRGLYGREARAFSAGRPELARGQITAFAPARQGVLIGHSVGDEGALFHFDDDGGVTRLIDDRVAFGFRLGGRLYFVTGSVHAMSTWGAIWEIDPDGPRVIRRIGLPAYAWRASATSDRTVVLETGEGAISIREDGSLADPANFGRCSADH